MIFLNIVILLIVGWKLLEALGLKHYSIRLVDYLRLQMTILLIVLCCAQIAWYLLTDGLVSISILGCIGLATALFSLRKLFKYSILHTKHVLDSTSNHVDVKLRVANLQFDLEDRSKTIEISKNWREDVVVLMEVNQQWENDLSSLINAYPHVHKIIREDPWGMVVLSKFPFSVEKEFQLFNETPGLYIQLHNEKGPIDLWLLHPKPPSPYAADTSEPLESEFVAVGKVIDGNVTPTIVAGDMNAVAWSEVTINFLNESNLFDPRVGRGLYASFPTFSKLFRFPLDQAFVSRHFRLADMFLDDTIGSDHFPFVIHLELLNEVD